MMRGGAGQFGRSNNSQKRNGGAGNQRSSSSNKSHHQSQSIQRNKEKIASERKMVVGVYCKQTDHYSRLTLNKDEATVNDVKARVLRDQGLEIPVEKTRLIYHESVLSDGNKKLLHYKVKEGWRRMFMEWEKQEGDEEESDEEEEEEEERWWR